VVLGDLNEGPTVLGQPAPNLARLVDPNGPLVEVYALSTFDPGPRPGTFQSCGIRNRLDYILVPSVSASGEAGRSTNSLS
jgi:hypothetical protein